MERQSDTKFEGLTSQVHLSHLRPAPTPETPEASPIRDVPTSRKKQAKERKKAKF